MYAGDRSRKDALVNYGFRLPSAYDNRPLNFTEFEQKINQVIYVSATPAEYEKTRSGQIVEQVIRPTGLLDPEVEVRPIEGQIDDLIGEINARSARNERVLVTTLTKKMAERLCRFHDKARFIAVAVITETSRRERHQKKSRKQTLQNGFLYCIHSFFSLPSALNYRFSPVQNLYRFEFVVFKRVL